MLNDKIENVQVFDAIVKKYAQKAIAGKTDKELTDLLRELAKRFESDFDTLFVGYQADFLLNELEIEISKLEKSVGMNDEQEVLNVEC